MPEMMMWRRVHAPHMEALFSCASFVFCEGVLIFNLIGVKNEKSKFIPCSSEPLRETRGEAGNQSAMGPGKQKSQMHVQRTHYPVLAQKSKGFT